MWANMGWNLNWDSSIDRCKIGNYSRCNLNFMHNFLIGHSLYPEIAQIDPWGKLFIYSNTYNGIFVLENNIFK